MRYLSVLMLWCLSYFCFADVVARLDEDSVQLGESVTLTISYDGQDSVGVPNVSALSKDFEIINAYQQRQVVMVNHQTSFRSEYYFVLKPKKTGTLIIPPFKFGQSYTSQLTLKVHDTQNRKPDVDTKGNAAIFMKVQASGLKPFISEQIIYTMRFYNSQRIYDINYKPPVAKNSTLLPLGNNKSYTVDLGGKNYQVDEFQYVIYPQKAGSIDIEPPVITAITNAYSGREEQFSAEKITLNVQPIPSNWPKDHEFLPASELNVSENYDVNTKTIPSGSTIERSISISAIGLPGELLPKLNLTAQDGYKIYVNQDKPSNHIQQGSLVGHVKTSVTYLFQEEGLKTIPEISIPWFNLKTKKIEYAVLPPRSVDVSSPIAKAINQVPPATANESVLPASPLPKATRSVTTESPRLTWAWWLVWGLLLLWVITVAGFFYSRKPYAWKGRSGKRMLRELKQACLNNDANACRRELMRFAQWRWPDVAILNIQDVARLSQNGQLKQQIQLLAAVLYGNGDKNWHGLALWQAIGAFLKQKRHENRQKNKDLPPLNPS